jgi:hypothetical protein
MAREVRSRAGSESTREKRAEKSIEDLIRSGEARQKGDGDNWEDHTENATDKSASTPGDQGRTSPNSLLFGHHTIPFAAEEGLANELRPQWTLKVQSVLEPAAQLRLSEKRVL